MQELARGVHQFQQQMFAPRRELFAELASGQRPHTLFITCSDSRINPHLLTQSEPGELFILRNPGNLVPSYGVPSSGEAAGVEYALAALDVEQIVVCGHSHCGAMRALVHPEEASDLPAMRAWLQQAETTRRLVTDHYKGCTPSALLNVAIQENVLVQIENLRTHPMVASRVASGRLKLQGWVYKLETGEVFAFDPDRGQFDPIGQGAPQDEVGPPPLFARPRTSDLRAP